MFKKMSSRALSHLPPVAVFVIAFCALGLFGALVGMGITHHLQSADPPDIGALRWWSGAVLWIWPGAIVMMVEPDTLAIELFALGFSAVLNIALYGLVGLVIGSIWQRLRSKT